ncbi:hypothetical protein [Silicimonas sp. MF1-12-2]
MKRLFLMHVKDRRAEAMLLRSSSKPAGTCFQIGRECCKSVRGTPDVTSG